MGKINPPNIKWTNLDQLIKIYQDDFQLAIKLDNSVTEIDFLTLHLIPQFEEIASKEISFFPQKLAYNRFLKFLRNRLLELEEDVHKAERSKRNSIAIPELIEKGIMVFYPKVIHKHPTGKFEDIVMGDYWDISKDAKESIYLFAKEIIDRNIKISANSDFRIISSKITQLPKEEIKEAYLKIIKAKIDEQHNYQNLLDEESKKLMVIDFFTNQEYLDFYNNKLIVLNNENVKEFIEEEVELLLIQLLNEAYSVIQPESLPEIAKKKVSTLESKLNFTKEALRPIMLQLAKLDGYESPIPYLNELLERVKSFDDFEFTQDYFLKIHSICSENRKLFWSESHRKDIVKWLKTESSIITTVFDNTFGDTNEIPYVSKSRFCSYKWEGSENELSELYQHLINKFIDTRTTLTQFTAIFSEQPIKSITPVKWISDNASELLFFILKMEETSNIKTGGKKKIRTDYQKLKACFVKSDGTPFTANFKELKQTIEITLSPEKQRVLFDLVSQF